MRLTYDSVINQHEHVEIRNVRFDYCCEDMEVALRTHWQHRDGFSYVCHSQPRLVVRFQSHGPGLVPNETWPTAFKYCPFCGEEVEVVADKRVKLIEVPVE